MDEQHTLRLVGGDDGETAIFTLFDDEGGQCRVRCEYRGKSVESTATDFFEALCDLRNLMAKDGVIPFCYGASLNVFLRVWQGIWAKASRPIGKSWVNTQEWLTL